MALKTILKQTKLDEPYIGGLGSYKLYVLVAHHLEQHLSIGGQDRPGQVLLLFWFRYGDIKAENTRRAMRTPLTTGTTVRTRDGAEADLNNVYLLDHIIRLFQHCWKRTKLLLEKHTSEVHPSVLKRKDGVPPPLSYFNGCIDEAALNRARKVAREKANNQVRVLQHVSCQQ